MPTSRRAVLSLLATGAAALAGCTSGADGPATSPTGTPTPTPTESPTTTAATPTPLNPDGDDPPAVETPTAGSCEAVPLPDPDSVPEELADDLSIASYPDKPTLTKREVGQFCYNFENAYWANWIIANAETDPEDNVETGATVTVRDARVRPVRDGYVAVAETSLLYTYEPITATPQDNGTETPTPTPIPSAPQMERTAYYVTDRFLLRQSPAPDSEEPSITGGDVVQCW